MRGPGEPGVGHAGPVPVAASRRRSRHARDPWSVLLVAVAAVWLLGSVVNVAYQVGIQDRSLWWLLEVPLSAAVAYLLGVAAWRRLRGRR